MGKVMFTKEIVANTIISLTLGGAAILAIGGFVAAVMLERWVLAWAAGLALILVVLGWAIENS